MEFQKDLTLKKLDELDFISFYQVFPYFDKNSHYIESARLDLWDCNKNFVGYTKKYSLEKIQKFLVKSLLQEL